MNKKETDILLIRKYLKGELDSPAMHQLEKRAQEDPFLMDAIEGYENGGNDQQEQLNDLTHRLQQRVAVKERKTISWNVLAIAASVIVIFSIGGLLLFNNHPAKTVQTAQLAQPIAKPITDTPEYKQAPPEKENELAVLKPKPHHPKQIQKQSSQANVEIMPESIAAVPEQVANANGKTNETETTTKDTTPLNEMVVMEMVAADKKNTIKAYSKTIAKQDTGPDKLLQARVAGVSMSETPGGSNINNLVPDAILKGRVIAKDNELPVPGASVRIAGTTRRTVTDINGRFSIPVDSNKKNKLVIAFIGYKAREINTNNHDSLSTIALEPANSSLNEVVVTGYSSGKKGIDNGAPIAAHPHDGWKSFRKYLSDKAISPDGKTGVVKLSFIVDTTGTITKIKVIKGLSIATDQKAISLIANGPDWVGSTSGRAEKVTIRIKFDK